MSLSSSVLDSAWEGLAKTLGSSHWVDSPLPGDPCSADVIPAVRKHREEPRRQLKAKRRFGLGGRPGDAFGVDPRVSHGLQFPCRLSGHVS